mmetsp:Transcript_23346/g.46868  ORF Transcript_23346/g.46868 Transcript_23346/m.46868 type:complete len:94 (-) Transcript_23346:176-457(-)
MMTFVQPRLMCSVLALVLTVAFVCAPRRKSFKFRTGFSNCHLRTPPHERPQAELSLASATAARQTQRSLTRSEVEVQFESREQETCCEFKSDS